MTITLNLKPQRNALLRGFDNEFYGLLEVKHTQQGQQNSPGKSLNLSIVLDRSGSMAGQPIFEAKQAAIMMVNKMRASDQISVVALFLSRYLLFENGPSFKNITISSILEKLLAFLVKLYL